MLRLQKGNPVDQVAQRETGSTDGREPAAAHENLPPGVPGGSGDAEGAELLEAGEIEMATGEIFVTINPKKMGRRSNIKRAALFSSFSNAAQGSTKSVLLSAFESLNMN